MSHVITPVRAICSLTLLILASSQLSGCAILAMKKQQEQLAQQQAEQLALAEQQQRDAARLQKIGQARQAYLEQALDAHDFAMTCPELREVASKEMLKNGLSLSYESNDTMLISNWAYVNAEYGQTYDHRVKKTRKSSKNRQLVEVTPKEEGRCDLSASYLLVVEDGQTYKERATDFEATMIKLVDPTTYEEIEREFIAIEQQFPAETEGTGESASQSSAQ